MTQTPVVVILGRPNVGKSTLFNRILRKRLAVVDDTPGSTRDRNYALTDWSGRSFMLVDTGGWVPTTSKKLERAIKNQVELAVEEADCILFLVDARADICGLDAEIASILRKSSKKVLLVVNKVDDDSKELAVHQFLRLGLGDPFPISAMRGRNIGDFLDRLLELLPEAEPAETEENVIRVAILGRPNVGKSSFVNALVGAEKVIVDETPGTTRDATDTPFEHQGQHYVLIDTAGLRRRIKITSNIEYYATLRTLRSMERCDVAVIMLDATEGITQQDIAIANQAAEAGKGIVLLVNKWDLVNESAQIPDAYVEHVYRYLPFLDFAPVLFTSMMTKLRVLKTIETIRRVAEQRRQRISTGRLNAFLNQLLSSHQPPLARGRQINIYYGTQARTEPPTFAFFCNTPSLIQPNYRRFLERKLREAFGFEGTPIHLVFRLRRRKGRGPVDESD